MHSRTIIHAFCFAISAGLFAGSLESRVQADDIWPSYPMSIGCFVHDMGTEYIPSRLIGREDIAAPSAGQESERWTCTDPVVDCARIAMQHARLETELTAWKQGYSETVATAAWIANATARQWNETMRRWNGSMAIVGRGLAEFSAPIVKPSYWKPRVAGQSLHPNVPRPSYSLRLQSAANIFVFHLENSGNELRDSHAIQEWAPSSYPVDASDRSLEALRSSTFARDYCVFAPIPESESTPTPYRASALQESSGIEVAEPSEATSVLQLQQRAAIRLQRAVSRGLVKNMQWLGMSLLEWSTNLEQSVRIAEAGEESWLEEVK